MAMIKFRAPALPLAAKEYDKPYFDQHMRVLNLFFNQLNSLTPLQAEYFKGRGDQLVFPHIAASDSTDQRTTDNTATVVKWDTLDSGLGWTLNAPGSATADFAGVYKITYSLQFINDSNAIHFATVWLKVNGVDVPNSTTKFTVPSRKSNTAGEEGYVCGYSEVTFEMQAGDTVELYWATDKANLLSPATEGVYIFHDDAQTTPFARPAIPSAIGSITFVSAIP
jgi:hypothetical protein